MTTSSRFDLAVPLSDDHRAFLLRRLVDSTERPRSGCWEFTGQWRRSGGRGQLQVDHQSAYAYRIAYALAVGPIPAGLEVCHHCDNERCVRPDHLFVGTHAENVQDMWAKGRGSPPPIGVRGTRS
jgi:hypothetical protein